MPQLCASQEPAKKQKVKEDGKEKKPKKEKKKGHPTKGTLNP